MPKDFASAAIFQRFLVKKKNYELASEKLRKAILEGQTEKKVQHFKDKMLDKVKTKTSKMVASKQAPEKK